MKITWVIILVVIAILIWFGENRDFYCLDENKCVTVWKTYNNTCYVIPGKYYGLVKPSKQPYIETTNTAMMTLIWSEKSDTIIVSSSQFKIFNLTAEKVYIIDYGKNPKVYDSLYTFLDGRSKKVLKNTRYMNIMVEENYATDSEGKKFH